MHQGSFFWLQSEGGMNFGWLYLEGTTLTCQERNSDARKKNPGMHLQFLVDSPCWYVPILGFVGVHYVGWQRINVCMKETTPTLVSGLNRSCV